MFDGGAGGLIKARPMSLCAAAKSGARRQQAGGCGRGAIMTVSASRWRSAGRRWWSARRGCCTGPTIKGRPMSLCAGGVSSGASRSNSWLRTRQSFDLFGNSVAISGETVVVGAYLDLCRGSDQGSAYVFVRSGEVWRQQDKLLAAAAAPGDEFGISVAISGETVVVGADGAAGNQGSAYVFVRSGEVWRQQDKLLAADAAPCDSFGQSVAISGETVVVGAPAPFDCSDLQGSAYVFVAETPPTITLKAPISLWPPNHKYQAVNISQMVQSASDAEDGDLINSVVIEKVTSDEPDNAPGGADGNTSNDIVIAGDCKSVGLRSERDETKNGRVYSVTLRVADSAGSVTRAEFKVSVPLNQSGAPAVEEPPAFTVTSACQ